MKKVIFILIIIQGIMLLFELIPYDVNNPEYIKPFLFSSTETSLKGYVWQFSNRISLTLLYYCIYLLSPNKYRVYAWLFIIMEACLVVEFICNYNRLWIPFWFGYQFKVGLSHIFIIFKLLILSHVINGRYTGTSTF